MNKVYRTDGYLFPANWNCQPHKKTNSQLPAGVNTSIYTERDRRTQLVHLNLTDFHSVWNSRSKRIYEGQTKPFTENELKATVREKSVRRSLEEIRHLITLGKKVLSLIKTGDASTVYSCEQR